MRYPSVSVDPEWGQYMYDESKEYYSDEEPQGGKLYYSNGLKKCYRYREILTYRYNIIPTDDNTTNNNTDDNPPQESPNDNAVTLPVTDNVPLVNLENYQSIEVPNTYKMNIVKTLCELLFGYLLHF